MGLFRLSSGTSPVPGNPVPYRFTILRTQEGPAGVAVTIRYPDATSYEGVKVCVYLGKTAADLRQQTVLDPHFTDGAWSPFARFEPTDAGWSAACTLVGAAPTGEQVGTDPAG